MPIGVITTPPFIWTVEEAVNAVPITVTTVSGEFWVIAFGDRLVIARTGAVIVNVAGADVTLPGATPVTVTCKAPALAVSIGVSSVLNVFGPRLVVVRDVPLIRIMEGIVKPVPVTVNSIGPDPALTEDGTSELMTGPEFVITMGNGVAAPPCGAGFTTEICAVPVAATSAVSKVI
jgi:hypothetical protein